MLESGENYLEAIYLLKSKNGTVRSVDVAAHLSVTKASVSRAMSILKNDGYIIFDETGHLQLTDAGEQKAQSVYERHEVLTCFLTKILGVSAYTAAQDACRFEHDVSVETFECIKKYLDKHADI